MATGAFVSVGYNDWFPLAGLSANAPDGIPYSSGDRAVVDPYSALSAGALTISLPTDPATYADAPAGMVNSYFDDFYNRIYIEPSSVGFGAITSDAQVTINIWNAYLGRSVQLTSVGYDMNAGLSISGPAIPANFAPLASKNFFLTASVDGPPVIDEIVTWNFDVPWSYPLPVTGSRSKAWVFDPNWRSKSYQVQYEFKTEIITSRSGKEQRIALRTSPRKSVAYQSLLSGESFRLFKHLMWSWQDKNFTMPELTRFAESTEPMAAGDVEMVFDEIPLWAVPGAPVMLGYRGFFELRVVSTVNPAAGIVDFSSSGTFLWPAGTRMYPALSGYVDTELSTPRETNSVAQLDMKFNVTPLSEPDIDPPVAATSFNGREVFLNRPNWASSVSVSSGHSVDELDFDRGPVFRYVAVNFGYHVLQATFVARSNSEAEDVYWFFRRMRGQQGEFYMPTWEYDFVPKVEAPAGSASLRVSGYDFFDYYAESTVHRAIFVLMNDGVLLFRKVVGIAKVSDAQGNDSLITVDTTWPSPVSESSIVMCGWMPVWRLSSDILMIEWLTDQVAQTRLSMVTIEDLIAE